MRKKEKMEKIYILLEKNLETGYIRVEGVYETLKLAQDSMAFLMDFNEEERSYKIEEKVIQDAV